MNRDSEQPDRLPLHPSANPGNKVAALKRAKTRRPGRFLAALGLTAVLLAAFAALLTLPLQAQSLTTFVTNTGGSGITDSDRFQAQSFETGANEGGYTVSQVDILLGDVSGKSTSVSIKEDNGGEPGNLVTTLTNPGTLTSNQFNTFTAPDIITLDANTTYWLTVNEGISSDRVFVSSKPADDELSLSGWGIGDGSLHRTSEMDSWSNSTSSLMMEILGTTSTDATLSDLALEDGDSNAIPLAFASDDYEYGVSVENGIDSVVLTVTKNDANAMVVITNDDDQTGSPEEAVLGLLVGSNTLTVTVTAEDGSTTQTYTVNVERAAAIPTLVSNTNQTSIGDSASFLAQSFETGTNVDGYTVSEVDIHLVDVSGRSTSVKIRENNASDRPGTLVATLTNPRTLAADSINTFTAPADTVLAADTTYWITANEGISSNRANVARVGNGGQIGEPGWAIGDDSLFRTAETSNWGTSGNILMIEIRGTSGGFTASTDATLSDLALEGATGGEAIALTPAFDADTITYTASVANRIDLVTLTATKNDDNAMVVITGDDDLNTPESAELDLVIGSNTLTVTVTAEDTTTTKTYTITVTQEKAPLVSNTEEILSGSGTNSLVAQSFKTGASVGGFTISEVQLRLVSGTDKSTSVRIRQDNNGEPATGDPVAILTNPATLTGHRLNTFTAPAGTTLAPSTTYWITTNEGIPSADRAYFQATNEDAQTGETGWSIGNGRLFRSGETDSWTTQPSSLLIAIKGTTGGYVASTDATLRDLAMEDDGGNEITLTPPFVTGTKSYTALVPNRVSSITLTPTVNDANATVEYLDASDESITDTDTSTPALDAPLAVLDNTFKVKVTAEAGGTNTDTYTVVVTREEATVDTDVLVSNTAETATDGTSSFQAQRFETGASTGEFTISEVQLLLSTSTTGGKSTIVRIREDDNGEPATSTPLATLTNPGTLTADSLNTFTAPVGTTLAASTTYWITVNEGIALNRVSFAQTQADDETGETGWSIGNRRIWRSNETDSWTKIGSFSLVIAIKGTAGGTTASADATLNGLALEDGDSNAITLDPTFESNTINYTASVANSTDSVTLTATKNDANATAAITSDDDTDTPDKAVLALVVGSNTLTVTVTAVNTTTTLTYTVNVTRTDVLVSNTGQTYEISDSDNIQAQSFVTGSRVGGYTISEVDLLLWHVSGRNTSVSIKENNSSNIPSTLVATLTNPGTLTSDSLNTFTAPTGTTLAAGKTYWITVNEGINTNRVGFRRTIETGKTGEADWSIGKPRLWKEADGDDWREAASAILLIAIKASPDSTTASTDATLRSLALENADGNTVTLNPTFASNTITYTASVANSDNAVALSAETNDSNATVAITNDDDTNTPNDAELDLNIGSNTLTVMVTAEDSTTTETYTVTVTRELHTVVTIAAQYPRVGAGIEDLVFMLTRTSAAMHELDVTVRIDQHQLWLDSSDLSHTVTFMAGSTTATLTLDATSISLMPNAIGNLTATAEGTNITGDSDTVEMISIATPPITVSYDNSRYTFAENAALAQMKIYALATLDPIYPRAPSRSFSVRFSTKSASANDVEDFAPIDWQAIFVNADYESDGDKFIASKRLQDNSGGYFAVVDDNVYEGSPELLNLQIQRFTNLTPDDLVRFAYPDGTTCVQPCSDHEVSITDSGDQPVLSLNANPTSISEEDDSMTPGVAENVSILTVSAASPKTFSSDKTIKLVFTGTATYGTSYTVSPADTDSNATGHQVTLPALSPSVQVTITAASNDNADGNKGITATGSLGGRVFGSENIGLPDDDLARTTDIQRVNSNGTVNTNTTVAGLFKVRINFMPSATGLLERDLEVKGGTIDQFVSGDISGSNVWYVDILPDQGATSVTVRVLSDVVNGGNPAAEVTYSAEPPLTPVFTTNANEPVIAQFLVTVTFSAAVTELPGNTEGDTTWYFSPAEDLDISHGDFVSHQRATQRDSGRVWNIFVKPHESPGTTTITLPHQRVATGSNTDFWNAEASIEVQAGRRSVDFELDTYTVDEGSNITVKVTLDADPLNTVEIPLTAEGQGDTSDADYSGVPTSLIFNTGETEQTFTFLATDDNSTVDGKSVKIAIGTPLPDIIKPGTTFETTVTITDSVTDLNEAPLAPDAPTVSATSGSTTSLDVSWTAPTNTGRPSIDSYDLRYRVGDTGAWTKRPQNVISTNASIDNLVSDTSYQVQVRAHNQDGNSPWSPSQTGTTGTTEENVLVSNTGQTVDGIGDPASFGAQSFSTGASNGGYTISEVRIRLNHVSPGATTLVSIREDNNGEPGDPVATLTNPASLTSDSVNTFTATAGTRLDPNTTYWITTNEGIVPTAFFALTVSYDETAGAGWSIGNTRLYRFRETSTMIDRSSWIIASKLLMIAIKGTAVGGASSDATLSTLRVNDGTNNLTLTPPFATGTVDYTASVGNAVTTVTLTATVNHAGASVSAVTLNGTTITDRNLTDGTTVPSLRVGSNEIVVTVTAENRTTRTYTVSVTRKAATGTPGVTVSKTALAVTEQDTTGNIYTLVLDSQPTASVTVTVGGHSGTDVTPSPAILTFTTNNWNVTHTVTVTAVDDADATSDTLTLTHSATSTDRNYDRITIAGVTVTVMDNDTANLLVNTPTLTLVEENSGTFTVKLATLPSANVTVSVSSSDTRAATVFPASLTFTTNNWNVTQTVTVSAVNDSDTTPETVTVTLSASGGGYAGETDSVSVSVTDNDTANSAPTFTEGSSASRAFSETLSDTTVATASDIGAVVSATDTDTSDTLEYRLEGTEATKFGIISTSGQLRTNVGEKYDHEAKASYAVTVRVMDGNGGSDTITVTLNVTDRNEAPLAPDAPQVSATSGSTTSLDVSWTAPTNTGRPGIDSYDLQYRVGNSGSFTNGPQDVTRTSAAIGNLAPNTSYQVHVRATNDEGNSRWSQNGDGTTNDLTRDPDTDVPSAPTGLTARTSDRTQIDLSWDTPASDGGTPITGYRIEVSSDGGSNWSNLVANTGNTNRTYSHTGLNAGDTRHYRVSAVNAKGTGPASSVATAQTTRRVRPSTMNLYFTESYGNPNESAEITHDANSIIGDCSGEKYFRAYWNGPSYPAADGWEVRAIPHPGGSVSQIRVRYRNDDPEWPEFIGKARFSAGQGDSSSISFAVRGRYGEKWSAWGPTSVLHCRHTHE